MRPALAMGLALLIGTSARADDRTEAEARYNLGTELTARKEYDKAIATFTDAIKLDPKYADAYFGRGKTFLRMKRVDKASVDFAEALRLAPENPEVLNGLAWTKATDPAAGARDGKAAVELARKALKLDPRSTIRDTLAAALAESGDFAAAVAEETKVLEDKTIGKEQRAKLEKRLELYKAKKPCRDEG